jgi:predicted nucleic acid-binding protein
MAKRLKIYLDTSVPNAYFDDKNPFRREMTREFWKKLKEYDVFVSDIVIKEIEDIGNTVRKKELLALINEFKTLSSDEKDIRTLTEEYIVRGVIPLKHIEDAIHIAVASYHSLDVLISWNFEHIVKLKTKREVNVINMLLGYNQLEIIEPAML